MDYLPKGIGGKLQVVFDIIHIQNVKTNMTITLMHTIKSMEEHMEYPMYPQQAIQSHLLAHHGKL